MSLLLVIQTKSQKLLGTLCCDKRTRASLIVLETRQASSRADNADQYAVMIPGCRLQNVDTAEEGELLVRYTHRGKIV